MKRTKKLRAASALVVLAIVACAMLAAGTAAAARAAGMEIDFAGDTAKYAAGQVAVPVECVGERTGFCSGTLTLFWQGKKSVSALSVRGGGDDTIFVPLSTEGRASPVKVSAVATT